MIYRVIAEGQFNFRDKVLYCGPSRIEARIVYEQNRSEYEWTQPQDDYQASYKPLKIQRLRMGADQ